MKILINIENVALFVLSVYLFSNLALTWWLYPLCFFGPDLCMVGYLVSPKLGAITYNTTHSLATAVTFLVLGGLLGNVTLQFIGIIIIGHSAFDRILGYGLKYSDSFQHTHLGMIGKQSKTRA